MTSEYRKFKREQATIVGQALAVISTFLLKDEMNVNITRRFSGEFFLVYEYPDNREQMALVKRALIDVQKELYYVPADKEKPDLYPGGWVETTRGYIAGWPVLIHAEVEPPEHTCMPAPVMGPAQGPTRVDEPPMPQCGNTKCEVPWHAQRAPRDRTNGAGWPEGRPAPFPRTTARLRSGQA